MRFVSFFYQGEIKCLSEYRYREGDCLRSIKIEFIINFILIDLPRIFTSFLYFNLLVNVI